MSWYYQRNAAMKVFSQLFVGLAKSTSPVPLAFATPYEDTVAGKKRQETVRSWGRHAEYVDGRYTTTECETRLIDNVPVTGFKITDDIKRVYWGGGNVVWRVEDPRGFELEIQSANLMALLRTCGIQPSGLIPGRCVWGREGSTNVLLHEDSDEFRTAVQAAENLKTPKQVGSGSRHVGRAYRLRTGQTAIFLGKLTAVCLDYTDSGQISVDCPMTVNGPAAIVRAERQFLSLGEPDPVEGVLLIDDDGELSSNAVLYKKAPLIKSMDSVGSITVTQELLDRLSFSYASKSSAYGYKQVFAKCEPIVDPVLVTRPLSEIEWATTEREVEEAWHEWKKGQQTIDAPLRALCKEWGHIMLLKMDTGLSSAINACSVSNKFSQTWPDGNRGEILAFPAKLEDKSIELVRLSRNHDPFLSYHGVGQLRRTATSIELQPTDLGSIREFIKWLRNTNALVALDVAQRSIV